MAPPEGLISMAVASHATPEGPKDPIMRSLVAASSYLGHNLGEYMTIRYLDP